MKFLSALYHLMHPPPHPRHLSTFLSGYPLQWRRGRSLSPPSSKRKVVWSRGAACTSGPIHAAIEQFQFTELLGAGWIFLPWEGGGGQSPVVHARAHLAHECGCKIQTRGCNSSVIDSGTRLPSEDSPISVEPLFPGEQMTADIFLSAQTVLTAPSLLEEKGARNIVFGKAGVMKWCCWLLGGTPPRVGRVDSGLLHCLAARLVASGRKTRPGRADNWSGAQFGF